MAQEISIKEAQQILSERGFDPGPADGLMGPKSRAAILEFQAVNGLSSTGELDAATVNMLIADRSPADSIPDAREAAEENPQPIRRVILEAPPASNPPKVAAPGETNPLEQTSDRNPQAETDAQAPAIQESDPSRSSESSNSYWVWILGALIGWLYIRRRRRKIRSETVGKASPNQKSANTTEYVGWDGLNVSVGNSSTEAINRPTQRIENAEPKAIKWHPLDSPVTIGNFRIDGLVYTGKVERYGRNSKHIINPALRVSATPLSFSERALPYWPDYSEISPSARATYLAWLADGRRAPDADVGYMFLFFYGLEYRFFQDKPTPQDQADIIKEVEELLEVYGLRSGSVQRYLGHFLEFAKLNYADSSHFKPVYERSGWEIPVRVRIALGVFAKVGRPVPSEWMLSWYLTHPECYLRTPAKRCDEEFRALFVRELKNQFPDGYPLRKHKKKLELIYSAASGEFRSAIKGKFADLTDVSALTKPISDMQSIVDRVTDKLEKYSRFLGRNPERRGSLEAQALLPIELRGVFQCDQLDALRHWAAERTGNKCVTVAADLIERIEGQRPEKVGKAQLVNAADALAQLGFGFAPDPRFSIRTPKADDRLVFFELGKEVEALEDVSSEFRSVLLELTLAAFIAHADGEVVEAEKQHMLQIVKRHENLTEIERRRLVANLIWLANVPPDMALIKRRIKHSSQEQIAKFRSAMVAIAKADTIIRPPEVAQIERIYATLGIDQSLAYSDLHIGLGTDGPIAVASEIGGRTGEAIPTFHPSSTHNLDIAKIDEIRRETASVSKILGDIFDDDEADIGVENQPGHTGKDSLTGLDSDHIILVQKLIDRPTWSLEEYENLAKQLSLLPDGALETINDWAFASYGDFLLEEYGDIEVLAPIADNIREEMRGSLTNG